jgi:hypothetical protein
MRESSALELSRTASTALPKVIQRSNEASIPRVWFQEKWPKSSLTPLWPFLSRQGGEMSLTIDDLCHRSRDRRRPSHATPARGDHTGLGPVCATLFRARLGARARVALGGDAVTRIPHGDRGLASDGAYQGTPLHQLPSGVESCHLVGPPWEPDFVGIADHAAGAAGGRARLRRRRHGGTPVRAKDQG